MAGFFRKAKHHLGNDNINTQVKKGSITVSILETTRELNADIILMGSHSRRWLKSILMGSVTKYLLHQTFVPLLNIPAKKHG
ncbi:MAG: universal stress protein [Pyrinomonadaceae bacterium]|nr:universal stress protein [Sphingobacteriaceae bacterium]